MSATTPVTTSPKVRAELLETRKRSFYVKDVAYIRSSELFDRRGRQLGLVVVILTTIVGTSVFASLQGDPSTAAKVGVGVISVLAALAAAIREFQDYEKRAAEFSSLATAFRKLRYRADDLLADFLEGGPSKDISKGVEDMDAEAVKIKEKALPRGYYKNAEIWVDEAMKRAAGGETDAF